MTKPRFRATPDGLMMVSDGLVNFTTNLAVAGQSKAAAGTYMFAGTSPTILHAAYRSSWLARACIDMPVDDALSGGRAWQGDTDQINKIEAEEKRLKWKAAVREARKKADLWGGAAIMLDDGGDTTQPLDVDAIKPGGLRSLKVFGRYDLSWAEIDDDVMSENYGLPKRWQVASARTSLFVDPTRMILFRGDGTLESDALGAYAVWGDSRLESRLSSIRDADAAIGNVSEMLYEASVDVVGIENLMQMLAEGQEDRILKRIELMRLGKSVSKIMVRDTKEEYERKAITFGAVPELLREALQVASGATGIPATRLLGRSPAGMNSTGDGDERVYFDRLDADREEITEDSERLDMAIVRSALGEWPEGLHCVWPPLRQVSEKDKGEITDKLATAWEKIARTGYFTQEEGRAALSNSLIEAGVAPGLEAAMVETDAGGEFDLGGEGEGDEGAQIGDAAPRTLYVRRNVLNADEIIAWAKAQGFKTTLPADDMHVTIAFSREPVDWMKMGESWSDKVEIAAGGARIMEQFGQARVLLFASSELSWRHEGMKREGATWDHPEYQPHITISYDPDAPDLGDVEPYKGKIILGPEIFEEVKEDWQEQISEE